MKRIRRMQSHQVHHKFILKTPWWLDIAAPLQSRNIRQSYGHKVSVQSWQINSWCSFEHQRHHILTSLKSVFVYLPLLWWLQCRKLILWYFRFLNWERKQIHWMPSWLPRFGFLFAVDLEPWQNIAWFRQSPWLSKFLQIPRKFNLYLETPFFQFCSQNFPDICFCHTAHQDLAVSETILFFDWALRTPVCSLAGFMIIHDIRIGILHMIFTPCSICVSI